MKARHSFVEALLRVKTYAAVEAAHGHCMDLLRLCRSDNMGVRDKVPSLKLRLGRDQECYDFCKWYNTTGDESSYDWGEMSNPYLDVKNADVFEPPQKIFIKRFADLSHSVAIILFKIRLLIAVRTLQSSSVIAKKVPQEILDNIRSQLVSGSALAGNLNVMKSKDQTALITDLEEQVEDLHDAIGDSNEYFWPALLEPEEYLNARPEAYSHGSFEEMQLVLQGCYDVWTETPGAVEVIRGLEPESYPRAW